MTTRALDFYLRSGPIAVALRGWLGVSCRVTDYGTIFFLSRAILMEIREKNPRRHRKCGAQYTCVNRNRFQSLFELSSYLRPFRWSTCRKSNENLYGKGGEDFFSKQHFQTVSLLSIIGERLLSLTVYRIPRS